MNTKVVIESRKMKTRAAPVFVIAAALLVGAGSARAAPPPARQDAVIAVSTSLDASPSDVMSPATVAAPAGAGQGLGLFEQESPAPLMATALVFGLARVAKAYIDRRRRWVLSRYAGGQKPPRLPGSRPTATPFLLGDGTA